MSAPIAALRDDFEDNATANAWGAAASGSATVAETGGQARFTLPSSAGAGPHIARYTSKRTYDLTGGSFSMNIQTMVATGVAATAFFQLYSGTNNLQWVQLSGTIYARSIVGGVSTDLFTASWNASTYKYLRIRNSGSNILWESSTNGTSWTTRATVAVSSLFAITDLFVDYGATCGNIASPGSFRLDDVNLVLPALSTTWRWTRIVWPLANRYKVITLALDAAGTAQAYVVTADGVDVNGDPSGNVRYWSGPCDGGRELTEQASDAAAKAMAVDIPIDGRFDLPTIIEARVFRIYHRSIDGAAYTLREAYPRRLVQADDMEAESIRALHIAAHEITADHIATINLDAIARITAGNQNVLLDDDGITVAAGTATYFDYLAGRAYTIAHTDGDLLRIYGNKTTGRRDIFIDGAQGSSTDDIQIGIRALPLAGSAQYADVHLTASNSTYEATVVVRADSSGSQVGVTADDFIVSCDVRTLGTFQPNNLAVSYTANLLTIANNGVAALGMSNVGFAYFHGGGATGAMFAINGGAHSTNELIDVSAIYSGTAGTASSINVYWSAANARYEVENKRGSTITLRVWLLDAA